MLEDRRRLAVQDALRLRHRESGLGRTRAKSTDAARVNVARSAAVKRERLQRNDQAYGDSHLSHITIEP